MSEVRLSGQLNCKDAEEAGLVLRHLPRHVELTRAEPGCISFEVEPTDDALLWDVEERFTDSDAFRAHQARVAGSEWGRLTAEVARDYVVVGLVEEQHRRSEITDRPAGSMPSATSTATRINRIRSMSLHLSPLDPDVFPEWLERSAREYAADLVALGGAREAAEKQAREALHDSFPEGGPTPDNAVFLLKDGSASDVGYVWVGRDRSEDPAAWWVWDVVVDVEQRGKGYGREAMRLAEDYARSRGADTLGLSVFGFNTRARGLYESLGYETTSIKMRKSLVRD